MNYKNKLYDLNTYNQYYIKIVVVEMSTKRKYEFETIKRNKYIEVQRFIDSNIIDIIKHSGFKGTCSYTADIYEQEVVLVNKKHFKQTRKFINSNDVKSVKNNNLFHKANTIDLI